MGIPPLQLAIVRRVSRQDEMQRGGDYGKELVISGRRDNSVAILVKSKRKAGMRHNGDRIVPICL